MTCERWEPDSHIIDAALTASKFRMRMTDLSEPNRCWLVAGLTLAGVTAQDIADRLSCSLRLVRTIRADHMTQVCMMAQHREAALREQMRKVELEYKLARRGLDLARAEVERLRYHRDQILDAHTAGTISVFPRCGHPRVGYNVYRSKRREYCRECRRTWDQTHRKRTRAAAPLPVTETL